MLMAVLKADCLGEVQLREFYYCLLCWPRDQKYYISAGQTTFVREQ